LISAAQELCAMPRANRSKTLSFIWLIGSQKIATLCYASSTVTREARKDGSKCLLEWKTTSSRYPEQPEGLLNLDPQLICYSWITGIAEVAQIVFVRKRMVEIQYFRTMITAEQQEEFGRLVEDTVARIESAQFLPHSGVRFPQNPCTTCSYIGLCLGRKEIIDANLIKRPGQELDWLDELNF
jgi:hypothetical protein